MPADDGGNTIHNTAALDDDNTVHPSVYAYNNYTVNLIYDKADFELDCDDERLDDAAFKGLGVTLDSTLNYKVYGDSDEKKAESSETLYYHFVRQGGYILPEQYVKLAEDVTDRTAYSGSDAVFAIYKASEVKRNKKGELVSLARTRSFPTGSARLRRAGNCPKATTMWCARGWKRAIPTSSRATRRSKSARRSIRISLWR